MLEVNRVNVVENHRAFEELAIDHGIVAQAGLAVSFLDIAGVEIKARGRLDVEGDGRDFREQLGSKCGGVDVDAGSDLPAFFARVGGFCGFPFLTQGLGAVSTVMAAGGEMGFLDPLEKFDGERLSGLGDNFGGLPSPWSPR